MYPEDEVRRKSTHSGAMRPDCVLDFSKREQVTILFGLNPHDERRNARPAGTLGAQIQYHRGGIPEHETDWVNLDIDTESPYIHIIHEDTPTTEPAG